MNETAKRFRIYDIAEDSLELWLERYLEKLENEQQKKARLHIKRFIAFFRERYSHDKVTALVKRDITGWQEYLYTPRDQKGMGFAASTVNGHLSSLSTFIKWLCAKAPHLLNDNPMHGIREIMLPDPEPRTLTPQQILSLKNICDRLERFHMKTDRSRFPVTTTEEWRMEKRSYGRPLRDRAIVYVLLSTGLRRKELTDLNIDQVVPNDPELLMAARKAKIVRVRGKGKTEGTVYLSQDARSALAMYLKSERPIDATPGTKALFLSFIHQPKRKPDGRLHPRRINGILEDIGKWHDGEQKDPERMISPLRPHDLRHTFAVELSKNPEVGQEDLIRGLRHRNNKYLQVYTKPPEERSAGFIEKL
ncbi:MAG: tyrosine-type recombinase/integrase [Bacillota bacterium]